MRISAGSVFALVLALACPIGAGCNAGTIESTTGSGGTTDFASTGDVQPLDGSSAFAVSTGGGLPPGVWLKHYGDTEEQHAAAVGVNVTGDIGVVGTVKGTIDFGNIPWTGSTTDTDLVVAQLSADGVSQWSRRFGDSCDQRGAAVAVAPTGNVVVAGDFCGKMDFGASSVATKSSSDIDAYVAIFDSLGEDIYSRSFGGKGSQVARGVVVDAKGDVVVVGSFDTAFDDGAGAVPSAGMDDGFVVELDPKGKVLWSLTFGGSLADIARGVALDEAGNVIVGGTFAGSVDFGGGLLTATPGHTSGFVLELDPNGKHLWSQSFDTDDDTVITGVAATPAGDVAATGYFKGTGDLGDGPFTSAGDDDVFLTRMDSTGKRAWARTVSGTKIQRASGVTFGVNGDVVIAGTSNEILDLSKVGNGIQLTTLAFTGGQNMIYALRFDPSGTALTGQSFDSVAPIESAGIGLDQKYSTVLAGSFQQQISFQLGAVSAAGSWDLFVARQF
jgi:hypothetical protein